MVAPLFVILALGMTEASQMFDVQNQLTVAAREGARLAAMDRNGLLAPGQSMNDKVRSDIKNLLTSNGLPADDVEVAIVDPYDHGTPFDLDDPDNRLKLFELRVELPYSAIGGSHALGDQFSFIAKVVFRNARAVAVQ
jgi:hypothetical protein